MIVVERQGNALCIGQAAHAWISGQLARAWGNTRFDRPDPWEEVCLAAEQHDIGMAEWDLAPTLDRQTGLPTVFTAMPLDAHLALWREAPAKALSQSPYAALLVSMHGHALYARRDTGGDGGDAAVIRGFLASHEDLQRDLLERLGEDPRRARRNQRLLWALDFLSLALFMHAWIPATVPAPAGGDELVDLRVEPDGPGRLRVTPWPFGSARLHVRCQARALAGRYDSERSLHDALNRAPWETLTFELRSAG